MVKSTCILQRTRVWFSAPASGHSQSSETSAPEGLIPSAGTHTYVHLDYFKFVVQNLKYGKILAKEE